MLDKLKQKAEELKNNPNVQDTRKAAAETLAAAKEYAKEFAADPRVDNAKAKGKEILDNVRHKAEDFVAEKTGGKGVFGFGKK